jgi:hypothetical protein
MKLAANREADATVQAAVAEAETMRARAGTQRAEAAEARSRAEGHVAALVAAARSDAAGMVDDALRKAEERDRDGKDAARRAVRTARANVEAVVADGRREYERLLALERQCVDGLAAVEQLLRQARAGSPGETERPDSVGDGETFSRRSATREAANRG